MSIIIPANTLAAGGFDVDNSLRFEKGSSDSLTRTFADDGNNDKFTFSGWFKRGEIGVEHRLFSSHNTGSPAGYASMQFHTSDDLIIFNYDGNNNLQYHRTDRKFRDLSAWYHIVIAYDTTQGTASNRFKLYINGVQETSFSTATYPDQNTDMYYNNNVIHYVGAGDSANGANFLSGYVSEVCLVDNAQLAADSFGEFDEDSNIWKPIKVSGLTFGNTGFYLEYKQAGTGTNASGMGADTSGNTNHFAVNNLTAVDQTVDTCTNNFSTINALDNFYFGGTLSEGNVKVLSIAGVESYITNTIPVATGKWYWEIKITASGSGKEFVGIVDKVSTNTNFTPYSDNTQAISYYGSNGHAKAGSGSSNSSYGDTFGAGDIIGVAMDLDNNKLYFSKNGTFQDSGDPTSGSTGTGALAIPATPHDGVYYAQFANIHNTASTFEANFGNPSFTGTDQADGNGFGSFEYAVPSGYFALCTKNLASNG